MNEVSFRTRPYHNVHSTLGVDTQIPTLYEPMVNFCSKWVVNSIFLYFLRISNMQHVVESQRLKGKVPKKKLVLYIESWIFFFLQFLFLFTILYNVIFKVTTLI
jgi:hypothetical protein